MNADKPLHCTCCGKRQREVESLIAPARNGLICNECVELLHDIEQKKTGDPVIFEIAHQTGRTQAHTRRHHQNARRRDRRLDWIERQLKIISGGFGT